MVVIEGGVSPLLFWELSYGEALDMWEAHNKRVLAEAKERRLVAQTSAMLTAEYVAMLFSKDARPRQVMDIFPDLFEAERKAQEQAQIDALLKINQQRMREFAERHNRRRKEQAHGTDS